MQRDKEASNAPGSMHSLNMSYEELAAKIDQRFDESVAVVFGSVEGVSGVRNSSATKSASLLSLAKGTRGSKDPLKTSQSNFDMHCIDRTGKSNSDETFEKLHSHLFGSSRVRGTSSSEHMRIDNSHGKNSLRKSSSFTVMLSKIASGAKKKNTNSEVRDDSDNATTDQNVDVIDQMILGCDSSGKLKNSASLSNLRLGEGRLRARSDNQVHVNSSTPQKDQVIGFGTSVSMSDKLCDMKHTGSSTSLVSEGLVKSTPSLMSLLKRKCLSKSSTDGISSKDLEYAESDQSLNAQLTNTKGFSSTSIEGENRKTTKQGISHDSLEKRSSKQPIHGTEASKSPSQFKSTETEKSRSSWRRKFFNPKSKPRPEEASAISSHPSPDTSTKNSNINSNNSTSNISIDTRPNFETIASQMGKFFPGIDELALVESPDNAWPSLSSKKNSPESISPAHHTHSLNNRKKLFHHHRESSHETLLSPANIGPVNDIGDLILHRKTSISSSNMTAIKKKHRKMTMERLPGQTRTTSPVRLETISGSIGRSIPNPYLFPSQEYSTDRMPITVKILEPKRTSRLNTYSALQAPDSAFWSPSKNVNTPEQSDKNSLALTSTSEYEPFDEEMSPLKEAKSILPDEKTFPWFKGDCIGAGAFGKVFLGLNLETWDLMAVKQINLKQKTASKMHIENNVSPEEAIRMEIELMRDLDDVNIVKFYGIFIVF